MRGLYFAKEAVMLDAQSDTFGLSGLMGLPTMNRPTQYMNIFVNQRPVKDKQLVEPFVLHMQIPSQRQIPVSCFVHHCCL